MLTKDLLRFRISDGRLVPGLLRATPGVVALADGLLAFWREGVGRTRGELEDAALPILHQSRTLVIGRGLQKLILDECRFRDPAPLELLRSRALAASAAALKQPAPNVETHRAAVAAVLGIGADALMEQLYGDLPDAAVLIAGPSLGATRLLEAYNMALCQGLLLGARDLVVTIQDADTGLRRKLLKALRFRRLLAQVLDADGGELRLLISGPMSVLDQASRYGVQLALFLPALACARRWRAVTEVEQPFRPGAPRQRVTIELSDELGLVGESAFLGYVPEELRQLQALLAAKFPQWCFPEAQLLPLPGGELVVPDLDIESEGRRICIELFHRWHGTALARRIDQLERGLAPQLAIGVDRALARAPATAALLARPVFARHGFLFSDLPVARVLQEVVGRWSPLPGTQPGGDGAAVVATGGRR
jgi:hypothetical protein